MIDIACREGKLQESIKGKMFQVDRMGPRAFQASFPLYGDSWEPIEDSATWKWSERLSSPSGAIAPPTPMPPECRHRRRRRPRRWRKRSRCSRKKTQKGP